MGGINFLAVKLKSKSLLKSLMAKGRCVNAGRTRRAHTQCWLLPVHRSPWRPQQEIPVDPGGWASSSLRVSRSEVCYGYSPVCRGTGSLSSLGVHS